MSDTPWTEVRSWGSLKLHDDCPEQIVKAIDWSFTTGEIGVTREGSLILYTHGPGSQYPLLTFGCRQPAALALVLQHAAAIDEMRRLGAAEMQRRKIQVDVTHLSHDSRRRVAQWFEMADDDTSATEHFEAMKDILGWEDGD